MKVIWRGYGCEAIFLLIAVIISSTLTTPTQGQLTQSQIEGVIKRFITSGSYEDKLKQILGCLGLGPPRDPNACPIGTDDYLRNEILLRLQMRERGQECTSDGKYNKPFYKTDMESFEDRENYKRLQNELLGTGLIFCNPFKNLYCSPQKKCECRPGSALNPDVCTLIVGGYCYDPGTDFRRGTLGRPRKNVLYDPFNSELRDGKLEIPPLQCSTCNDRVNYFHPYVCVNDAILELDKKLVDHFKDLPRLNFSDPCNFDHHEELIKSPEGEWADYTIRVKKLEEIMGAKTQFCDLRQFLVCGNSGKCECIKPTVYDESIKNCTYKHPTELCSQLFAKEALVNTLTREGGREVDKGYMNILDRDCKDGCVGLQQPRPIRVCRSCRDLFSIGNNCDESLTSFLRALAETALPTDEPDFRKQVLLLTDLSNKGKEFEKLFLLKEKSPCDMEADQEGARAIRRIKNLNVEGMVATKEYYRETIRLMDTVIRKYSAKGLCKYPDRTVDGPTIIPDLVCAPTATAASNSTCNKTDARDYLEVLKKRLISFETIPDGQPCPLDVEQLVLRATDQIGITQENYQNLVARLDTHFLNKTQFCDSTADLTCQGNFTTVLDFGKCRFSEELKKRNDMKKSGDSRANASHFNNGVHLICFSFLVSLFTLCCTI